MAGRAVAGDSGFQGALLHEGEELVEVVGVEVPAADKHQRIAIDEDDGDEILLGIERQILVQRDVRRNLQVMQEKRVAVRCRLCHLVGADDRAAAGDVLDDEALLELL